MADDTDKVSINVSAMDLANIDLLVEKTLYKDRTDFFRTATRNQVDKHSYIIESTMRGYEQEKEKEKTYSLSVWVGSRVLDREELMDLFDGNEVVGKLKGENIEKTKLIVFGSLTVSNELTFEEITSSISSLKVYGIFRASQELKNYYK